MEKRTGTIDWRIRAAEGEPEKRTIYGYAIVYGAIADLGWFTEEVQPGFASEVLAASDLDVRALFNHNVNHVLARKRNSDKDTLQLKEDATGLYYEFEAPNTTTGNDLLENIRLGNVSQSSFGFDVKDSTWIMRDGKDHRILEKAAKLYDVSPVTMPAYNESTVGLRSKAEAMDHGILPKPKTQESPPAQNLVHLVNVKKRQNQL